MIYPRGSFFLLQYQKTAPLVCAEIGVFQGINAAWMLSIDPTMTLQLIDPYLDLTNDPYELGIEALIKEAETKLLPFKERITWVRKKSEEAVKDYADNFFDYVYIDGNHFEGVGFDIPNWYSKVKKGGLLAGHDVGMPTVREAFEKLVKDLKINSYGTKETPGESDWWLIC